MIKFDIVRRIATIKEWGYTSLELNVVKWGDNEEKYDLRRWEGNTPGKGLTLTAEDMENLFDAIGEELDLFVKEEFGASGKLPSTASEFVRYEEIDYRNFFVHGDGRCNKKDHYDQERVVAILNVLHDDMSIEEVEIPATFCMNCNAYYISEEDFIRISKKGRLMCQLMSDQEYKEYKAGLNGYMNLNPESKLKLLGYTVNSRDNYPDEYRQRILSFAIDSGVVTKKEAIGYLSFFIQSKERYSNCTEAVEKWHRDRDFLTGYKQSGNRHVGSKRIMVDLDDYGNIWDQ